MTTLRLVYPFVFALILLAPAPTLSAAQSDTITVPDEQTRTGEAIQLRFDWPAGLRADVSGYQARHTFSTGEWDSTRVDVEFEMAVQRHPVGLVVRHRNYQSPDLAVGEALVNQLAEWSTSLSPDLVLFKDGYLFDIEGLEESVARARKLLDAVLAPMALSPQDLQIVENMKNVFLNEDQMYSLAIDDWSIRVEAWLDRTFELGTYMEVETQESIPVAPDVLLPYTIEFGVAERVPCGEAVEAKPRCVRLVFQSYPDPDGIADVMDEVVAAMFGSAATAELEGIDDITVEVSNDISVVVEPNSLLPHRYTYVKTVYVEVVSGAETEITVQEQIRDLEYRYR